MLNRFTCLGNLTKDPQLVEVAGKYKVCKFSIAINNQVKKTVLYLDIEAWNKTAENCNKYLEKGSQVALDGRLDLKQWQAKSGENKSKIFCVADNVHFLKKSNQQNSDAAPKPVDVYDADEDEVPF